MERATRLPGVVIQLFYSEESEGFVKGVFGGRAGIVVTPLPRRFSPCSGRSARRTEPLRRAHRADLLGLGRVRQDGPRHAARRLDLQRRNGAAASVPRLRLRRRAVARLGDGKQRPNKWAANSNETAAEREERYNATANHPVHQWARRGLEHPEKCNGVGNGGLSLRNVAVMRSLAREARPPGLPEDVFYCTKIATRSETRSTTTTSARPTPVEVAGDFSWEETNLIGRESPRRGPFGCTAPGAPADRGAG